MSSFKFFGSYPSSFCLSGIAAVFAFSAGFSAFGVCFTIDVRCGAVLALFLFMLMKFFFWFCLWAGGMSWDFSSVVFLRFDMFLNCLGGPVFLDVFCELLLNCFLLFKLSWFDFGVIRWPRGRTMGFWELTTRLIFSTLISILGAEVYFTSWLIWSFCCLDSPECADRFDRISILFSFLLSFLRFLDTFPLALFWTEDGCFGSWGCFVRTRVCNIFDAAGLETWGFCRMGTTSTDPWADTVNSVSFMNDEAMSIEFLLSPTSGGCTLE